MSEYIPLPSEVLTRKLPTEQDKQATRPMLGVQVDSKAPLASLESNPYRQTTVPGISSGVDGAARPTEPSSLKPFNPFKQSTEEASRPVAAVFNPLLPNLGLKQPVNPSIQNGVVPLVPVGNVSGFFQSRQMPAQTNPNENPETRRIEGMATQAVLADPRGVAKAVAQTPSEQDGLEYSQITSPYPEHPKHRIGKPTSHTLGKHQCHEGCEDCMSELEQQDAVTVRQPTAQQVMQAKDQQLAEFMAQLQREELPNNNQENFMRLYSPSGSLEEEDRMPKNQISGRLRSKGRDLLGDTSSQIVRTMERTLDQGLGIAEPAVVTPRGVKTVITKTTTKDKHGNTLPHHIVKFLTETAGSKSKDLVYQIDEYQAKNYLAKPKVQPGGSRLASTKLANPASPKTGQPPKKTKDGPVMVRPEDFWPNPKKFTEKILPRFELTELQRLSVEAESMRHSLSYVTPKYDPHNLNFNLGTLQGHKPQPKSSSGRPPNNYSRVSSALQTPNSKQPQQESSYRHSDERHTRQQGKNKHNQQRPGLLLSEMTPEQIEKKVADSLRDFRFE